MTSLPLQARQLKPGSISLSFKGFVNIEFVDSIVNLVAHRLEQTEKNINTRKKVFGILIEVLQNLCKHIDGPAEEAPVEGYDARSTLFQIEADDNGYEIRTGNFVENERVAELKTMLDTITSMSLDELKKFYTEVLRNKTFTDKGGAGLGLIDIARKADNNISYIFEPVDSSYTFFDFAISVKKTGTA